MHLLRSLALAPATIAALLVATSATAAPAPTYGIRVYELFQSGPRLVLEERTSRSFEPHNVRNVEYGVTWPAADQPPLRVLKSRDHIAYFGSYWREDGKNEFGEHQVDVTLDPAGDAPGVSGIRVKLGERRAFPPPADSLVSAPVADSPSYQVKLYEVLQRGPDLVLEERTTRAFGTPHIRNARRGEVLPPKEHPGLGIWKSRDHFGFFGAAWREDGRSEKQEWKVVVQEIPGEIEMGATLVRVVVTNEALERGVRPNRRVLHPDHDARQRAEP